MSHLLCDSKDLLLVEKFKILKQNPSNGDVLRTLLKNSKHK